MGINIGIGGSRKLTSGGGGGGETPALVFSSYQTMVAEVNTKGRSAMKVGWEPDITPALWVEVSVEEWPEIPEVIPSTNPFMKGDKGTWKGEHYICQMDNCVWNPDQYPDAWEKQE